MQKMLLHIIHQISLRMAMLALAMLALWIPCLADMPGSQKPSGSGSDTYPYLIGCVEEFMWINNKYDNVENVTKVYRQTADLDFDGYEFENALIKKEFTGTYDGDGYSIKNIKINWTNPLKKSTHYVSGIFLYIGKGTVRNMVLENISLVYDGLDYKYSPASSATESILELGILCANAYSGANIQNIIIKKSEIKALGDPRATNYFVGGIAGDVRKGSDDTSTFNDVIIKNISVSADIDLSTCTRHAETTAASKVRLHQFLVGGIVGRIRSGSFPINTYYEGTINAPIAMVGPCYGGSRYGQGTIYGGYFTSVYAGQIKDPGTGSGTNKDAAAGSILGMDGTGNPDANRYYRNYRVRHYYQGATPSDTMTVDEVTNEVLNPSDSTYYYGTRTFKSNYPYNYNNNDKKDKKIIITSPASMASFQGVNHGTYASDMDVVTNMFNNYADSFKLKRWHYIPNYGFEYLRLFAVNQTAYDTFTPVVSTSFTTSGYEIKWTLTKSEDDNAVTINKLVNETLCIASEPQLVIKDVCRYKKVKAELIKKGDTSSTISYEIDIPEIEVFIKRNLVNTFEAIITDSRDIKCIFKWYQETDDGVRTPLETTSTLASNSVYTIVSETLPDRVGVQICDGNGDVYYKPDGLPLEVEVGTEELDPSYKVTLTRKKTNSGTYFVAKVYNNEGILIAGGYPGEDDYKKNDDVHYVWECTKDVSNTHNFTKISNRLSYFKGYVADTYYKVTVYYNGWEMNYALLGNKDVIFVYDKSKHEEVKTFMASNDNFNKDIPLTTFDGKDPLTKVEYSDGNDENDGRNPERAVKSLEQAYKLLNPDNGPDDNIIVVMGFNYEPYLFDLTKFPVTYDGIYNKAATITGKKGKIEGGAIVLSNQSSNPIGLRGATKFENISLAASKDAKYAVNANGTASLYLYCQLHDLTFGENVVMRGYSKIEKDLATLDMKSPHITIIVGFHDYNKENGDFSSDKEKCVWNKDPDFSTLTINSGKFGRIIGASRNNAVNSTSHNIFGNPLLPHRVKINVDIHHSSTGTTKEFWPDPKNESNYDIGLLAGGQTDGSVYCEAEITMQAGIVGRFISGNISFGRDVDVYSNKDLVSSYPCDSYFGSTTFSFRGGTIEELYGGSLGRLKYENGKVPIARTYFYGRSIINIEGGTVLSDLCGAGAGGVAGVGRDEFHTEDKCIPYYSDNKLKYGKYNEAKGNVAKMKLSNETELDFFNTYSEINVKYGTLKGDIYGAGGGYSKDIEANFASSESGNLYGNCTVTISEDDGNYTTIEGNVYGAGKGAKNYYNDASEENKERFKALAQLHGNCNIKISGGIIKGDVFAGAKGVDGLPDMAAIYGYDMLEITNGTILGNIYGGSQLANIRRVVLSVDEATNYGSDAVSEGDKNYLKNTGDTNIEISGGIIGNCIFGGSQGMENTKSTIEGDTHVTVTGGEFLDSPYIDTSITDASVPSNWNVEDKPERYRNFNIYGGGNINCDVNGTAYVKMYSSLLNSEDSFVPECQNPNSSDNTDKRSFKSAYMDITYRRFCVYGGGYGENTNVLNTDVYVTIPPDRMGVTLPHGYTLDSYLPKQSFFDIAGGGYSGNVGYWVDASGERLSASATADDYVDYRGGNCKVTIDGYTYARKIIGGGFYGSCANTNTHVRCGSLRQVYGGSLLGDVHQRAYLQFGNRIEDFVRKVDGVYVYDERGVLSDSGVEYQGDRANVPSAVLELAEARAKALNDYIYVTENIYGGNDVKGIIGTKKLVSPISGKPYDLVNGYPLFCTNDASTLEDCGIVFNIYGGTFMGDVYGAGNGHYRGYYVPEWVRYSDGPAHLYRTVRDGEGSVNKVYDGRPMVGNVNINIRGNSEIDRIHFTKNFYGGGRECTIGQWNTLLPVEDPRRLVAGGHLHVNFGGYTDIDGNVYMGAEGSLYASQPVVPADVNFAIYKTAASKKTMNIDALGDIAYYHWYFDANKNRYLPGFPPKDKTDGNYGFTGEHMFRAYLKNIEMECDVELTFYRNLYKRDDVSGEFKHEQVKVGEDKVDIVDAYGTKLRERKRWIPYEMAVAPESSSTTDESYDAQQITMTSFFLGGACGSMSNNNVMDYQYPDDGTFEKYPAIYRVSLPKGVLIKDAVVMGSQDAEIKTCAYADDNCKTLDAEELYTFKGGMVTHSSIAFDLIVYNDMIYPDPPVRDLPSGFYDSDPANTYYTDISTLKDYVLQNGDDAGTTIHRKNYSKDDNTSLKSLPIEVNKKRYDFAAYNGGKKAYIGPRAKREGSSDHLTVVKLGASCTFEPQLYDDGTLPPSPTEDDKHAHRYGGIIYGGCYNSGITIGDVVLNVASDMLGAHYPLNSEKAYGEFSRLKYNKGRVFGGGFGPNTDIQGNTYVNLINKFRGMNVFGGGLQGSVSGTANVTYIGDEKESYVYGAIYGGGLQGDVGIPYGSSDATAQATLVRIFSGNVDKVYGGSCMANLYGRTFVELADQVQTELDHLDYTRLVDKGHDWTSSRLIAGTVYAGNDIAGTITPITPAPDPSDPPKDYEEYREFTSSVLIHEEQNMSAKDTPGSRDGYNGFPLVGSLYGGSNGNYGKHDTFGGTVKYSEGTVYIATGHKTQYQTVNLSGDADDHSDAKVVPIIDKAKVDIKGGTIIDAYTGGNMATLSHRGVICVDYDHSAARAGFGTADELKRVWNALHLSSVMQLDEVIKDYYTATEKVLEFNIFRLFGGNDNATMAIQPEVDLLKGDIGSVYSGGNFGAMTYYKPYEPAVEADPSAVPPVDYKPPVPEAGLTLTINSNDIKINNVYGGGRLGDIIPDFPVAGRTVPYDVDKFYGATLNINGGNIKHIYGGNDVSGYIYNGTNVNIHGAISGDVYCAGNGDYNYVYDRDASLCDYLNPKILEGYQLGDNTKGERYFVLPAKADYGGASPSAAQLIMAVNSYRPHVERAMLNISGSATSKVWVGGNVYCGGNSATVTKKDDDAYDVIFNIGDYVTLNGVFLGSNGENLALGSTIQKFEDFNHIDMTQDNDLVADDLPVGGDRTAASARLTLYPKLLDLYMRAVETTQQPEGFKFRTDLTDAYIGEFCVGGNRGSIMTDKRITIDFPDDLNIYGRIIGGSKNANVTYNGVTHVGGLTVPLSGDETVKVELKVRCKFLPLKPVTDPSGISLGLCMVDTFGVDITDFSAFTDNKFYKDKQCNVYGGCFTSGKTVGGINIDLYSDMINYAQIDDDYKTMSVTDANSREAGPEHPEYIDRQAIINDIRHPESWRNFTIVGAGYGADTEVWGNINVRMLPTVTVEGEKRTVIHPSVGTIFGGSQEGLVVGNTNVEIRDGRVFTNVYGASEAAKMYGSTSVIVGYPRYYRALCSGNYRIERADYMSEVSRSDLRDGFGEVVVAKAVAYRKGDIVAQNVYEKLLGRIKDSRIQDVIDDPTFRMGKSVADEFVTLFSASNPIDEYFEPLHKVPADFGGSGSLAISWKDIEIWVGDQNSNIDSKRKFFGQGNIYGGGYIPNSSDLTLIGQPTIMRFTREYNPGLVDVGDAKVTGWSDSKVEELRKKFTTLYGGNTSVIMWDNEENADYSLDLTEGTTADGSPLKDHVHIGTGYFKQVEVTSKSSAKGLFKKLPSDDAYIYQTVGKVDPDALDRYYEKIADGGVYGGGRKVFAQAFRSIDLAYYGYAEHTPQKPKLLNTIQRADMATIRDCCMDLVGASDFTLSDYKDIYYAINRVGELRMFSSLDPNAVLDVGRLDSNTGDGIYLHEKKRSRNFIALYNRTNHLGAFRSNWTIEDTYHSELGALAGPEASDYNLDHAYPTPDGKVSYVNRKHRYIDVYNKYHKLCVIDDNYYKLNPEDRVGKPHVTSADIDTLAELYLKCTINEELDIGTPETGASLLTATLKTSIEDLFKQRNKGTSGNMIGINSGYELSIEGLACQRGESTESRYYGPAYGITEIKILTTVSGMGGGYIYALNHHFDPVVDGSQAGTQTSAWCSKFGRDFLNTTGNFVFPGASYITNVDDVPTNKYNYIIDDCFDHYDPINHGYYGCIDMGGHDRVITKAPPRREDSGSGGSGSGGSGSSDSGSSGSASTVNVNDTHEIHYWYVSGNTYVYNVTVTGITSDTSPEEPRNFYIDNTSGMINLFNVKQGTIISVEDVTWFEHEGSGIKDCDLTHHENAGTSDAYLSTQYKLYLTLDNNTRNNYTDDAHHVGAYAIRIPRHSYKLERDAETGDSINELLNYPDRAFTSADNVVVRPNMGVDGVLVNAYRDKIEDADGNEVDNHPRLGIRLVDGQRNRLADQDRDAGLKYFNDHLAGDHNVQVTIKTRNGTAEPIIYIINIDIRYLMGPALFGNIQIENCALPGEYIYVNANDVEVLMDENLGVSKQSWRMYPNVDGSRIKVETPAAKANITDPDVKYNLDDYAYYDLDTEPYTIENTDKVIHIPAYLYHDGWEVAYEVVANGEYFESMLPYYGTKADPEDPSKTVTDYSNILYANRLHVHNYHRMKPVYGSSVLDLRLTSDARVYIESQADMDYFFDFVNSMQSDLVASGYQRFTLPTGQEVNPKLCKDLNFYLTKPLEVPNVATRTGLTFQGKFHGMGHNLTIPDGDRYLFDNEGSFYNVGFISDSDSDKSHAFNLNNGSLYNCFYFNKWGKGSFLGGDSKSIAPGHEIVNCYENTLDQTRLSSLGYKYDEILHLSTEGFRYGQAAYNLNGYYLKRRHILLHGTASNPWTTINNSFELEKKDKDLRTYGDDSHNVEYIEDYYRNGDYRYAFTTSSAYPEALRTEDVPNYLDRLNNRKNGLTVSLHDASTASDGLDGHRVDASRWCENHGCYHPQFEADYLFFGQDLSVDFDEFNTTLPCAVSADSRVYRVGGFYGSASDKGYFFNRDAYLDAPLLTAVDFVGYRDKDLYDSTTDFLKNADRADIDDNGWVIKQSADVPLGTTRTGGWQEVYYPPSIDLPWVMVDSEPMHDFEKFKLDDSKVTHNLLVYTRNNDKAAGYLSDYHYDGDFKTTPLQYHSDAGIKLHHIVDQGSDGPVMYGDYFHLVDGHDFNAPVAFKVKQGWYTRKPTNYADNYVLTEEPRVETFKTSWETICLPFDVAMTYAATTDRERFNHDMGEITHFFGDESKGHEYWLRRLVGLDDDKLRFERPTSGNEQGSLHDKTGDLVYNNSTLRDLYHDAEYQDAHDELYHGPTASWSRTITDYRYLTGGVPYIVTYPGKRFYEFDLSGNFYTSIYPDRPTVVPQSICYFMKQKVDDDYATVPITDSLKGAVYDGGDYSMKGTFVHATNDPLAQSVLNTYVEKLWVVNDDGTEFRRAGSKTSVLPFRAYVYKSTGGGVSRGLIIGGDVQYGEEQPLPDEPDEPETFEAEALPKPEVWVHDRAIYIRTPYDLETEIYNISGQLVRRIKAYKGLNRYSGLHNGFYIVLRTKLAIM